MPAFDTVIWVQQVIEDQANDVAKKLKDAQSHMYIRIINNWKWKMWNMNKEQIITVAFVLFKSLTHTYTFKS